MIKRLAAPEFLRRAPLGFLIDACVFFVASRWLAPQLAQEMSFLCALAFGYWPFMMERSARRGMNLSMAAGLGAVTLLAFFVRGGVFDLLAGGLGWPPQPAIVPGALAGALVLGRGYEYCVSIGRRQDGAAIDWRTGAIGVVVLAVALRFIYARRVELMPEETYYWNYAQHLDFGYLDHPPMVGWLIAGTTAVLGENEFGVRMGALCCGAVASFFSYRLTREMFDEPSGLAAVVLVQILPFFFLTGFLMTPDAPLTAAWSGMLYFTYRALMKNAARAWWGAGVCLGLGLLSKYTIVLLGCSALLFMVIDPRSRHWFRRVEPYSAALLAALIFAPVLVWNARNDFASFAFQTSRRLADRPQFALFKLLGSALVLLTPTGAVAAAWGLLRGGASASGTAAALEAERRRGRRFIQVTVFAPLAVFAVFSLRHEVKLDWTGAPWVASLPVLAAGMVHSLHGMGRSIARAWVPTVIVLLLLYGAGLYDLAIGIPGVGYGRHAELVPVGWRELGRDVGAIAADIGRRTGTDPLIVGMDRYAIASELAFYLPDRARAVAETTSGHLFGQVGLMYERWFPAAQQSGRQLLLIAWSPAELSDRALADRVTRLDPIQQGALTRDRQLIRPFFYRVAYGYLATKSAP
jgi:dolichol-phosphate mannosyltransferase